jgi:dihydrofolate reductase
MARLLYSVTMSLDGYIAGPGGDMHWLTPYLGPNPAVDALVPRIGALLVGRGTYDGDDPNKGTSKEGAFEGTWDGPQVVLTHRPPSVEVPGVTFATDLTSAVEAAREAAGASYVNILGANVAAQCLAARLVDEVFVCIAPLLLGDGVRLFDRPGGLNVPLELRETTNAPLVTTLHLRVVG